MTTLLLISGSLRAKSYNTALLRAFNERLPQGVSGVFADISHIPLFNQDTEDPLPEAVRTFKEAVKNSDGIVFATPEYNRSIPGVLKNAIDWATRPEGTQPFSGMPVYILGVSVGLSGTMTAQYDLRRIMTYFGAHVLGTPEFFGRNASTLFGEDGALTDVKSGEHLARAATAFSSFVLKIKSP
jgi:chromate reductase